MEQTMLPIRWRQKKVVLSQLRYTPLAVFTCVSTCNQGLLSSVDQVQAALQEVAGKA